jgi:hypothetical protein
LSPADLQRFAVKIFAERPVEIGSFIPVFHRWIRDHAVEGTLIDVADYGHLPDGPGVVLVGHDADYFMDSMEGPLGLLYNRKQPTAGALAARVEAGLRAALAACARLEEEFGGRLSFRKGEALFLSNDRLLAPNDEATFAALRPALEAAASAVFGKASLRREAGDPRRRLSVLLA